MMGLGSIFWPPVRGSRFGVVSDREGQTVFNRAVASAIVAGAITRLALQAAPGDAGSVVPWIVAPAVAAAVVAWGRAYYRATGAKLPNRVLIVDDDAPTRESMERLIRRRGWDVDSAGSLAEAVAKLAYRPACVIVDVGLGGGESGLDLFHHFAAGRSAPRTVVISGAADPVVLAEIRAVRPSAVFAKPVADWPSLLDCLGDPFGES